MKTSIVCDGDLILFRRNELTARLIRFATFMIGGTGRYNHVAVVMHGDAVAGPIIHDCLETVQIHPLADYTEDVRSGRLRLDIWRPTEGHGRHAAAVAALLLRYPKGTAYDVGRLLLGMFPRRGLPICSVAAGYYLMQRFGRWMPYVSWKRRESGERQDGQFLTVDALTRLREPRSAGGTPWLRYVGQLSC